MSSIFSSDKAAKWIGLFSHRAAKPWRDIEIEIVDIAYKGEFSLEGEDIIEGDLVFRKNNSLYSYVSLYVPVSLSRDLFSNVTNSDNGLFFDALFRAFSESIVFFYNRTNLRSYITAYHDNISVSLTNEFHGDHMYTMDFHVGGKKKTIYFNMDGSQLFANKI